MSEEIKRAAWISLWATVQELGATRLLNCGHRASVFDYALQYVWH